MRIDPRTFGFQLSGNVVVPVVVVFLSFKLSQISFRCGFQWRDIVERALIDMFSDDFYGVIWYIIGMLVAFFVWFVLMILSVFAFFVMVFGCNFAIGTTIWTMIIIYAS